MNAFMLAAVLISVGVGCLVGGLIAAAVSYFMSRASSAKVTKAITVATDQVEEFRAELVKLRTAIVQLTEAVDEVIPLLSQDAHPDPEASWNLVMMNRAAKLAMR